MHSVSRTLSKVWTCTPGPVTGPRIPPSRHPFIFNRLGSFASHTGVTFCTKDKYLSQPTEISTKNPCLPNSHRTVSTRPKVICKSDSNESTFHVRGRKQCTPPPPPAHRRQAVGFLSRRLFKMFKMGTGRLIIPDKSSIPWTLEAMTLSIRVKILWIDQGHLPNHGSHQSMGQSQNQYVE